MWIEAQISLCGRLVMNEDINMLFIILGIQGFYFFVA